MDTVDAVAQAIFEEHWGGEPAFKRVFTSLHADDQDEYRRMARAAIDALGLTEETATIPVVVGRVEHTQPCELPDQMIAGEEMHTCGFRSGHFEFHPSSRLVSGWVRKDNTNE